MAITLSYGNQPPGAGRVVLGEQVRNDDQATLVQLNHELWACAGESLGGLLYDRAAWTTSSTTFGVGGGWALSQWQPVVNFTWRLTTLTGGSSALRSAAWVRNCDIRVLIYSQTYTLLATLPVISCTSNTPQWISATQGFSGLSGAGTRICAVQARRAGFAADGALYHFGAKAAPATASQIPT